MGYWKDRMIELSERGYSPSDKSICPSCVSDPILAEHVRGAVEEMACSFCGSPESAEFEVVLESLSDAILAEYTDPANELPYESREGGYQGTVYYGHEIVGEMGVWTGREDVLEEAASCFAGSAWCERDYFSLKQFDTLRYGWERFVEKIRYVTRFLFLRDDPDDEDRHDEIKPKDMLAALGHLLREHGTVTSVESDTHILRARVHEDSVSIATVDALGPPPRELARMSNRMSPAGISMFYGALDRDTAVAETIDWSRTAGMAITMALFQPTRRLRLLDLTQLPDLPSQFSEEDRHLRGPFRFLQEFVRDLTKPVARDGYEHVDYVPTQVVTEYLRYEFKTVGGDALDGILYESARQPGGVSMVLFMDCEDCGPRQRERWSRPESLMLRTHSVHRPGEFAHLRGALP
jgi:hypothetical protein